MSMTSRMPPELHEICTAWSREMEQLSGAEARMRFAGERLPDLLTDTPLFADLIERIARGKNYPDIRHTDAFANEILLYLNPKRIFSLRMFLFGPEDFTPVHDHNAWGVTGSVFNALTVVRYRREDPGAEDGRARLTETGRATLSPGDIEFTLPLDAGIHQTGSAAQAPMVMVSVYGSPVRRLYVNRYDLTTHRIHRMYAPRMKKKRLAESIRRALRRLENG